MYPNVTDLKTWILENKDRIFRILHYKKVFTPYEQENAFMDESEYEDNGEYQFCFIREAVSIGGNDWLIGYQPIYLDDGEISGRIEYARLSDIRLSYKDIDMKKFEEAKDPYKEL